MIESCGKLLDSIKQAVMSHGATPQTRIIVREGPFGVEREIEYIKARHSGRGGIELIIQTNANPVGH